MYPFLAGPFGDYVPRTWTWNPTTSKCGAKINRTLADSNTNLVDISPNFRQTQTNSGRARPKFGVIQAKFRRLLQTLIEVFFF